MIFKREFAGKLETDLHARRSTLLLGPRQTGKTTLIKAVCAEFKDRLEYDLRLPSVRLKLEQDPEVIVREVQALPKGKLPLVFIDEIQKVPALMDVLQYLLDNKMITLIASGSSARKLRHSKINWLPGRIKAEYLHPLTWREAGLLTPSGYNEKLFEEHLLFGGLPGIMSEKDIASRTENLAAYSTLYLEEEIRQEAAVRRLPSFAKFLQLAALESGTSPNLSKLANEVGVSHTTLGQYYQILEDSLIIHRLDSFGHSRCDVLKKPRYYFFDMGVRNSAAQIGHAKAVLTLQNGVLFEHHVILEVIARNHGQYQLSFWRTKQGQEVDLVMQHNGKVIALEIKHTAKPRLEDFKGLKAFGDNTKCDHAYLLCNIDRPQQFPHGKALPWWQLDSILV